MSNYYPGMRHEDAVREDSETLGDWVKAQAWMRTREVDGETRYWCSKRERFLPLDEKVADLQQSAKFRSIMGSREDVASMNRMGL